MNAPVLGERRARSCMESCREGVERLETKGPRHVPVWIWTWCAKRELFARLGIEKASQHESLIGFDPQHLEAICTLGRRRQHVPYGDALELGVYVVRTGYAGVVE